MDQSHPPARRLLIVSPGFAPANTPDSHRARLSLPHWKTLGWEAEVLAVEGEDVEAPQEPELLDTLPSDVPVHRVRAWPLRLTRKMGVGSLSWRAGGALRRAGDRLLAAKKFDLVFLSTSQFGVFPLGPHWLKTRGTPYILDFQDPWVSNYYDQPGAPPPPGKWKNRLARWLAHRNEPRCVRQAAGIVSVSPQYLDDFSARYPWFTRAHGLALPFPAADTDLARVEARTLPPPWPVAAGQKHLVAVGAVGPYMRTAVEALCRGLGRLRHESESTAARLRLHFIGTAYSAAGAASVLPAAQQAGVADLIEERTTRVPYLEALRWQLAADALAVFGSNDPGYIPSRLANVFWLKKPVMPIALPESSLTRRLGEWGQPFIFGPDHLAGIAHWLQQLVKGPAPFSPTLTTAWHALHSSAGMTRQLANYFEVCLAIPPRPN